MPEKSITTHKRTTKIHDGNYMSDKNVTYNTVSNHSKTSDINYSLDVPNIDNIILLHDVNKKERYLNLNLPKSRYMENFPYNKYLKKILINLVKKNECRNNKKMNCFDIWFDQTYRNENYTPYTRNEVTYEYNDDSNDYNASNKQEYRTSNYYPNNQKIRLTYNYSNTNKNYVDDKKDNKKRRSEYDNYENNKSKKYVEENLGNIDNFNNDNFITKNKKTIKKLRSVDDSPPIINKINRREKIDKSDLDIDSDQDPEYENVIIKDEDNINNNREYSKKEKRLIKRYKKAMHLLRKVIRSFKKRKKLNDSTINDLTLYFKKWLNSTFLFGLNEFRKNKMIIPENTQPKNNKKIKKEAENKLLRETQLKNIIDFLTDKRKKIQAIRDIEDKSWSFYKWYNRIYSSDEEELDFYVNNNKKKDKITPGNVESSEKKEESDNKQKNISNSINNSSSNKKTKMPIIIESKNPIIIQNIKKKKYYNESESNHSNSENENGYRNKFTQKINISNASKNEENSKIKNNNININAISLESNQYDLSQEQNEQTDEINENIIENKKSNDFNNNISNNISNKEKSTSENYNKNYPNIKNKNIIVISTNQNTKNKQQRYHKIKNNYDDIVPSINYVNNPSNYCK